MKKIMEAIGQAVLGGLMGVGMVYGGLALYSLRAGLPMPWEGIIG